VYENIGTTTLEIVDQLPCATHTLHVL